MNLLARATCILLMGGSAFAEGLPSNTAIISALPEITSAGQSVLVRVAVNPAGGALGTPNGAVTVSNGEMPPYSKSCTINLVGIPQEIGECRLDYTQAGSFVITATYPGNGAFASSVASRAHTVRGLSMFGADRTEYVLGESTVVQVALDVTPWLAGPQPTGSINISDGIDGCVIQLSDFPLPNCLYKPSSAGSRFLQAAYSGDNNFPAITSALVEHKIHPRAALERVSRPAPVLLDADFDNSFYIDDQKLSADGRHLVFSSITSLVQGDTNGWSDVFVLDRKTGKTSRVSIHSSGAQGSGHSSNPSISADGRWVTFNSAANNLVSDDTNPYSDIFVHDRNNSTTVLISRATNGAGANSGCGYPSMSDSGSLVAFQSYSSNLAIGSGNVPQNIFMRDLDRNTTERISSSIEGQNPNGTSSSPDVSPSGRYVTFHSDASNLVLGDNNDQLDVFVHDRQSRVTKRVSLSSAGLQSNGPSFNGSVSEDGLFVTFHSQANNLVVNDNNGLTDIFIKNTQTGAIVRVGGNGESWFPSIASNGKTVAFSSHANNLVPGDTNGKQDIFTYNTVTNSIVRVSTTMNGIEANGYSAYPSISADGTQVVFVSTASNLASGDSNQASDVFVKHLGTLLTTRLFRLNNRTQASSHSGGADISGDGQRIAFQSDANNLFNNDREYTRDLFIHDRNTNLTTLISTKSCSEPSVFHWKSPPRISADGRFLAYCALLQNLAGFQVTQIFVRDLQLGATRLVSRAIDGAQGNDGSIDPDISADGRFVSFTSLANNLVTRDDNNLRDIFVQDLTNGRLTRVSIANSAAEANGASYASTISGNGRYVTFTSEATNLVVGDTNGHADAFVRDRETGSTTRASVGTDGIQGNGAALTSSISDNGRFVVFDTRAKNLGGNISGSGEIYVRDTLLSTLTLLSRAASGGRANKASQDPTISGDGKTVAFVSSASNLVANDSGEMWDIFLTERSTGRTTRISETTNLSNANGHSSFPRISDGGSHVVFMSSADNLVPGDSNASLDVFVNDADRFFLLNGFERQ